MLLHTPQGLKIRLDLSVAWFDQIDNLWNIRHAAPERAVPGHATSASDVWSLGICCFEMTTVRIPHRDQHAVRMLANLLRSQEAPIMTDGTAEFRDFVSRLVTWSPTDRPTARQMLAHAFLDGCVTAQVLSPRLEAWRIGRPVTSDAVLCNRMDLIRKRATEICIALHHLSALELIRIIDESCAPFADGVRFGAKWELVCTIKHFRSTSHISP